MTNNNNDININTNTFNENENLTINDQMRKIPRNKTFNIITNFKINGRIKNAEIRGCSDTYAAKF